MMVRALGEEERGEIEAFVVNPITVTYQFGENLIGCYGIGVCDYACRVKDGIPLE